MFTSKVIASLFLIATAGLLDAGRGAVGAGNINFATGGTPTTPISPLASSTPALAGSLGDIRRAVAQALAAQVRRDLDDPGLAVDVSGLSLRRESPSLVSIDGEARVSLGAGRALPLHVEADWDAGGRKVARLDYHVDGAAVATPFEPRRLPGANDAVQSRDASFAPARGQRMRAAIEARLNAGMAQEFAQQQPRFELVSVERIDSGRYRMLVTGTGITRFPGEGAAFTRFSASIGKFDGRVAQADYELLQELDAPPAGETREIASR